MRIKIKPSHLRGEIDAPPSKSYAHRMMLCAALAEGESVIRGIARSEDMLATLDCIKALGAEYTLCGDILTVKGTGGKARGGIYPCRESGSTLRFLIPAALLSGEALRFEGAARLMERGVGVYEEVLSKKGIVFRHENGGLSVEGELCAGEYTLRGDVSSQFISGLLFALPLLSDDSVVRVLEPFESRSYVGITLSVMEAFGVKVEKQNETDFLIRGGGGYGARRLEVEGDWSNGASLLGFAVTGGDIEVRGLCKESLQGDRVFPALAERLDRREVIDISDCPDLGPVLFAIAAAKGGGRFRGTSRLRIKESDRAAAMAEELAKFGIAVTLGENEVNVLGGELKKPSEVICSHTDHRIVMATSLLGSLVGCEIEGAEAVAKSYPSFFEALAALGLEVEYVN